MRFQSSTPISTLSTISSPSTIPVHSTKAQASAVASASVTAVPSPAAASISATTVAVAIVSSLVGLAISGLIIAFFLRRWSRKRKDRQRESMNFHPSTFRRSAVMLEDPLPPRVHAHDFGAGASFRSGSAQSDYRDSAHTAVAAFHQYPYGMPASAATYTPQHYSSAAAPASAEYYNYGASQAYAPPQNLGYAPPVQQVGIPVGYPPELHRQGAFPGVPVHPSQMPPPPPPAHYQHYSAEDNDDAYGGI
ncbi:hypothetical protein GGX14DRAFT_547154 [Mycena pura]|uniref:Transmembrane protein n=1 Tax=Mycena pura TaxID=153505 RepID=A0AAD6UN11_9AGAR|nr:hypothetical protein GGX14DRAFT_547154 [Mycena pura]